MPRPGPAGAGATRGGPLLTPPAETAPRCTLHPRAAVVADGRDALGDRWRCEPGNGDVAHLLPRWLAPAPARTGAREALRRRVAVERMALEARRGVLGQALRAYAGHGVDANRAHFDGHEWTSAGEEWTASPAWKASVVDGLLAPLLAGGGARVLEIGAGAGRWTPAIASRAGSVVAVDVSGRALEHLRARLGDAANVETVLVDGPPLPSVAARSIDAVWSFDVFVHMAPADVDAYLGEIARVLAPGGRALVHHAGAPRPSRLGWRAPMTARLLARRAEAHGLLVRDQFRRWAGGREGLPNPHDVVTLLDA